MGKFLFVPRSDQHVYVIDLSLLHYISPALVASNCSVACDHGVCSASDMDTCICNRGWEGEACDKCKFLIVL